MGTIEIPEIIAGTDAFLPNIPPAASGVGYDFKAVLRVLEACYDAGFRGMDFSLRPDVVAAVRQMKSTYKDGVFLLGNPSWKCGVELHNRDLLSFRSSILKTIYQRHSTLEERIREAPLPACRRSRWNDVFPDTRTLTESEIQAISLNVGRFVARLNAAASVADAILLGADYADWLPLLGRIDLLEQMFEIAAAIKPVFSISHLVEIVLPTLDKMPVEGHFIPYGKHTALFSHEGVRTAASASRVGIAGTFSVLRERLPDEDVEELIEFAVRSFPSSALLLGVAYDREAKELVKATTTAKALIAGALTRVSNYESTVEAVEDRSESSVPCCAPTRNKAVQPYAAVSLTPACNYQCCFCPPGGEQYSTAMHEFKKSELNSVLQTLASLGFRKVRFSGGEPFLFTGIREAVLQATKLGLEVFINSNGVLLKNHIDWLAGLSNVFLRINLSALQPSVMRKVHGQVDSRMVVDALESAADICILQRINFVLTVDNLMEVEAILRLCHDFGIGMKIFDVFGVPHTLSQWNSAYAPLEALQLSGTEALSHEYSSNFGIPTRDLVVDDVQVRIRDSTVGSKYHNICRACKLFPCQEGFYCITVTPSLAVLPCRLGCHEANEQHHDLETKLERALRIFAGLEHRNGFWADRNRKNFYQNRLDACNRIIEMGKFQDVGGAGRPNGFSMSSNRTAAKQNYEFEKLKSERLL